MKKGSRFLIGLAAAGLSFGALMASLGPAKFNTYGHRNCGACYYQQQCGIPHNCSEPGQK